MITCRTHIISFANFECLYCIHNLYINCSSLLITLQR
nr:MAG TPA: hypothetical protein [Caudoviricetes sp.]